MPALDTWHFDPVEFDGSDGDIEQLATYTLHLNVYDTNGIPSPGQDVKIFSEAPVYVGINGEQYLVSQNMPVTTQCVANGQVTLTIHLDDSLGVPVLTAWTTGMPENGSRSTRARRFAS